MSEKVVLAVYDLTQGMAKNMSMMLLGQQIDAVDHSAILVYARNTFTVEASAKKNLKKLPTENPLRKSTSGWLKFPRKFSMSTWKNLRLNIRLISIT